MRGVYLDMTLTDSGDVIIDRAIVSSSIEGVVDMLDPGSYVAACTTSPLRSVHTLVTNMMKVLEDGLEAGK